jgi:Transcriptional regulator, AbiEi antitoxin
MILVLRRLIGAIALNSLRDHELHGAAGPLSGVPAADGVFLASEKPPIGVTTACTVGLSVVIGKLASVVNQIPASLRQQARNQDGIITRRQAIRAGVSADKIAWLLKRGTWQQVYRGVYVTFTGPVPSRDTAKSYSRSLK